MPFLRRNPNYAIFEQGLFECDTIRLTLLHGNRLQYLGRLWFSQLVHPHLWRWKLNITVLWGLKVVPHTSDGVADHPSTSELVYDGYAGAGTNYLCLPKNPEWASAQSPRWYNHVHGAEYQTHDSRWNVLTDHDVPCAVCRASRATALMILAKQTCPSGWILEYYGFLMSEGYNHASSKEFVCMDGSPKTLTGTYVDRNGALFYFQQAACVSLPCDPYKEGRELTCVVCTK